MAKSGSQKLKMLWLAQIFNEHTDEDHGITVHDIIQLLAGHGISADRKTLYQDIEELKNFGMDIIPEQQGRNVVYKLASRDFEAAELKLLVDSIQASRFITGNKSRALIKKLEKQLSIHKAGCLQRQVVLTGRVKATSENIYYNVDTLHTAIDMNRQITFYYFQWNIHKEKELRHNGRMYKVSPWALIYDDENYYLAAYDSGDNKIKHYRVDKMLRIALTDDERSGRSIFDSIDLPDYSNRLFGMYGGEPVDVTLECADRMAGTLIDRFGTDIVIIPTDEGHFRTHVKASASLQFLGWLIALGSDIKLTAPESMVEAMKAEIRRLNSQYM